jgi:hypothetical protein
MSDHDREHPIPGMIDNPEWRYTLTRRAELYLAERERRKAPEREPFRPSAVTAALAAIAVATMILSFLVGVLFS